MGYIPALGCGDLGKQIQSFQFQITQKHIGKKNHLWSGRRLICLVTIVCTKYVRLQE